MSEVLAIQEAAVRRVLKEEHAKCKALFVIFRGQCEGCEKAAMHNDSLGTPLCCECDARLTVEAIAEFDSEFPKVPASTWKRLMEADHKNTTEPQGGMTFGNARS